MKYKLTDENSGETFESNSLKEIEELIYGKEKFPVYIRVILGILMVIISILLIK